MQFYFFFIKKLSSEKVDKFCRTSRILSVVLATSLTALAIAAPARVATASVAVVAAVISSVVIVSTAVVEAIVSAPTTAGTVVGIGAWNFTF